MQRGDNILSNHQNHQMHCEINIFWHCSETRRESLKWVPQNSWSWMTRMCMGVSNPSCSSRSSGSLCSPLPCGVFQSTHSFTHLGVLLAKWVCEGLCYCSEEQLCDLLCIAQRKHPMETASAKRGREEEIGCNTNDQIDKLLLWNVLKKKKKLECGLPPVFPSNKKHPLRSGQARYSPSLTGDMGKGGGPVACPWLKVLFCSAGRAFVALFNSVYRGKPASVTDD